MYTIKPDVSHKLRLLQPSPTVPSNILKENNACVLLCPLPTPIHWNPIIEQATNQMKGDSFGVPVGILNMRGKGTQMSYTCKTLFLLHCEFQVKLWIQHRLLYHNYVQQCPLLELYMTQHTHTHTQCLFSELLPVSDFQEWPVCFIFKISSNIWLNFQTQKSHSNQPSENNVTQFRQAEGYTSNPHHCH
jgi:hypothetical protein